jgi:hypothetical protein
MAELTEPTIQELQSTIQELTRQNNDNLELFQERISQLELSLEDFNWARLTAEADQEFSRQGLRMISQLARVYYLKNPLIQRGVRVTCYYVFGQGITLAADDDDVNECIQHFLKDTSNRAELTTQQALTGKETELEVTGNLFFTFFTDKSTGRVRVRTISLEEIQEIFTNPEDRKDNWYYKRSWTEERLDPQSGNSITETKNAYYPDWHFNPPNKQQSIGGIPVRWSTPVFQVKVGGLPDMKFGVCEYYAGNDWARAYKDFLEDWATIVRAYSRFAWNMTVQGGKAGIQAAKRKIGTTVSTSQIETNPPPVTGSINIQADGTKLEPIRTSGATTSAEDGRRLLLMVCAVMGLPETFFGDISKGNHATAKTVDRPTELKMKDRQTLWSDTLVDMLQYVVEQSAKAPSGLLNGKVIIETAPDGTTWIALPDKSPVAITCTFPPILEHDVKEIIGAIVDAATLGASGTPAGTIDMETVTRLLCQALGIKDAQAIIDALGEEEKNAADASAVGGGIAEAARELKEAIQHLKESYAPSH